MVFSHKGKGTDQTDTEIFKGDILCKNPFFLFLGADIRCVKLPKNTTLVLF